MLKYSHEPLYILKNDKTLEDRTFGSVAIEIFVRLIECSIAWILGG